MVYRRQRAQDLRLLGFTKQAKLFLMQQIKEKEKSLSRVRLSATPWTATYQAPPSVGFSRQEYWSGVPLPSPYATEKELLKKKKKKR